MSSETYSVVFLASDSPSILQFCDNWTCEICNKKKEVKTSDNVDRYSKLHLPTKLTNRLSTRVLRENNRIQSLNPAMSGLGNYSDTDNKVLAVVGCVAAVCSAYHDGAELVQHIKAKRKARKALKQASQVDETTQELEVSLNRGEGVVRSQYDRDFRRFGDPFASGDQVARDALKDITIHLQQQVISTLKLHWQQDTFVDFTALQDVSDSSQDQCIVVLMQLQQRIVTSSRIDNLRLPSLNAPNVYDLHTLPTVSSNLVYTPATAPSSRTRPGSTFTSRDQSDQGYIAAALPSRQNTGPLTPPHTPYPPSGPFAQSPACQHSPCQAPATHYPPTAPFAQPSPQPHAPSQASAQYSLGQTPTAQFSLAQASATQYAQLLPDALAPSPQHPSPEASSAHQYPPPAQGTQLPVAQQQDRSNSSQDSHSLDNRSNSSSSQHKPIFTTTQKIGFFGIHKKKAGKVVEPPRNPLIGQYLATTKADESKGVSRVSSIRGSTSTTGSSVYEADHLNFNPWQGDSNSTDVPDPTTTQHVPHSPNPIEKVTSSLDSLTHARTNQSVVHVGVLSNRSINSINPKDLLPSEINQYAGFCKGAWRQQIGDRKKAIEERVRPGGMYSAARFLQCKQCKFEGRLVPANKKQNGFDMRVFKLIEGIQFRWEFLFKSHIMAKDAVPDPTKGTFGCIFCCAEGKKMRPFEGVMAFMCHLVEHRDRLPIGEVLYRMNCLVGRQAGIEEDFDINIVSREGGTF
ncbi:MAG: hypothetical protein Q9217_001526 [Psora testacea]